mgnify:CR=1 FL=1
MRLFDRAFTGSSEMFELAEAAVNKTYDKLGAAAPVAFGSTAYYLPCIYAYLGLKVTNMSELKAAMEPIKALLTRNYRLNDVFTSGIATVLAADPVTQPVELYATLRRTPVMSSTPAASLGRSTA